MPVTSAVSGMPFAPSRVFRRVRNSLPGRNRGKAAAVAEETLKSWLDEVELGEFHSNFCDYVRCEPPGLGRAPAPRMCAALSTAQPSCGLSP